MKYESILMILIFLFYQVSLAQNMLSDYNLEQRAFVYDIWTFDSLVAIKSPNINHPQICIEKKNLSFVLFEMQSSLANLSKKSIQLNDFENIFKGIGSYQGSDRDIIKMLWKN